MARVSRNLPWRGLGFAWYKQNRMDRAGLRIFLQLAQGEQDVWDSWTTFICQVTGISRITAWIMQGFFQDVLSRLLNNVTVYANKTQYISNRLQAQVIALRCDLRRERRARKKANRRAERAEQHAGVDVMSCAICFGAHGLVVLTPCGHACICEGCAVGITQCPLCRSGVQANCRLYL